jgi:hypothetical protein
MVAQLPNIDLDQDAVMQMIASGAPVAPDEPNDLTLDVTAEGVQP